MATLTLHNGDCLEVMKDISANSIDLIICDLPYGCLTPIGAKVDNKGNSFTEKSLAHGCSWDVKIDLAKFWEQAKRILKNEHSPVIHFCTTKFGFELYNSNPSWFRYDLVWDKLKGVSFLSANRMPLRSHEMIYVFSKSGAYYNRIDIDDLTKKARKSGGNKMNTVYGNYEHKSVMVEKKRCVLTIIPILNAARPRGQHPTAKPTDLYRWLIERYCPPDGTILDPTFGSANSVFTAFEMGRTAIGIEKDKAFYDKANERKKALLPKNEIVDCANSIIL